MFMALVLRLLSIVAALAFLLAVLLAARLFWEFNYGDCADGCGEGMAYILFLPALILAAITGAVAVGAHFIGNKVREKDD